MNHIPLAPIINLSAYVYTFPVKSAINRRDESYGSRTIDHLLFNSSSQRESSRGQSPPPFFSNHAMDSGMGRRMLASHFDISTIGQAEIAGAKASLFVNRSPQVHRLFAVPGLLNTSVKTRHPSK